MYSDDNSDWLPPGNATWGLNFGQYGGYGTFLTDDDGVLPYYIYNYLTLPAPSAQTNLVAVMTCPGAVSAYAPTTSPAPEVWHRQYYGLYNPNFADTNSSQLASFPFGVYKTLTSPAPSLKLNAIGAVGSFSTIWAMVDLDQLGYNANLSKRPSWYQNNPPNPIHGKVRNYIFFDGHAGTRTVPASGQF